MATNAQLADAQKLFGTLRNVVAQLQAIQSSTAPIITKYNSLSAGAKTTLLGLVSLDQAEADSIISTLTSINTSIASLPNVTPSF